MEGTAINTVFFKVLGLDTPLSKIKYKMQLWNNNNNNFKCLLMAKINIEK